MLPSPKLFFYFLNTAIFMSFEQNVQPISELIIQI